MKMLDRFLWKRTERKLNDVSTQLADMADDEKRSATIVIAAADTVGTYGYDYKCTGTNDEITIAAAISALPVTGGKIIMLEGTYSKGSASGILLPSNTEIEILAGATFTLANGINADACFFANSDKINGNSNISIHGAGKFNCNFRNQTNTTFQYLADYDLVSNGKIDVYITEFTMLEAKLRRSNVELINRKFLQKEVVFAECESADEFIVTTGACTTEVDGGYLGGNCIKLTPNTHARIRKALPLEVEANYHAYEVGMYVKIEDPTKILYFAIGSYLDTGADELEVLLNESTDQIIKLFEANKWCYVRVPLARYILDGVPMFRIWIQSNAETSVYIDQIKFIPAPLHPALTWIWDDAMGGTSAHKALPGVRILTKYGHRGAIAQMGPDCVGGSSYMTAEELDEACFEYGWDICVHSVIHFETDITFETAMSTLLTNKKYIEQNGWRGSNYLVFSGHDTRGEITSAVKRIFNGYRNPLQYPPASRQGRISTAEQITTFETTIPHIARALRRHLWLHHYSHGVGGTQISASELVLWAEFFYDWGLISKTPSEVIGDYNSRYDLLAAST